MSGSQGSTRCPYCQKPIGPSDLELVCPVCDIAHHPECWQDNHGCASAKCPSKSNTWAEELGQDEPHTLTERRQPAPAPEPEYAVGPSRLPIPALIVAFALGVLTTLGVQKLIAPPATSVAAASKPATTVQKVVHTLATPTGTLLFTRGGDLYQGTADGKNTAPFVAGFRDPVLSADGQHIIGVNADGTALQRIPRSGGTAETLYSGTDISSPTMSSNGTLVFSARSAAGPVALFSLGADTSEPIELSSPKAGEQDREPVLKPDGKELIFTRVQADGSSRLLRYDMAKKSAEALKMPTGVVAMRDAAFSPDGTLLAFCASTDNDVETSDRVYLAAADGSHPRQLLPKKDGSATFRQPAFSTDGKWLAFTQHTQANRLRDGEDIVEGTMENDEIGYINVNGSGLARVGDGVDPYWLP